MDTVTPPSGLSDDRPDKTSVPSTKGAEVTPTSMTREAAAELATRDDAVPLPEDPPQQKTSHSLIGGLGFIFSWIIFPVAAVFVLHFFVFQAYHVVGTSMQPTLHTSDYLIISKVDYTEALIARDIFHRNDLYIPHREQIVVFHYPKDPTLIFIKRVIGLPRDHVVISGGKVTIYNKAHPQGFDPNTGYEPADTQTLGDINVVIPAGQIFVLGDNRTPGGSFDSRDWGDVPSSYIIGNAVLRLLPLDQSRLF